MNAEELAAELLPALLDLIEAERKPPPIVTADELAAYLKVSREVIYRNAERLGAIRLPPRCVRSRRKSRISPPRPSTASSSS
ncbi:MAG: HTH domain-containing protein [Verrucomicrobiaceae bacterium]